MVAQGLMVCGWRERRNKCELDEVLLMRFFITYNIKMILVIKFLSLNDLESIQRTFAEFIHA